MPGKRERRFAAAVAAAALLLGAVPAGAGGKPATVSMDVTDAPDVNLSYRAGTAAARLLISRVGASYRLADAGTTIRPGAGCRTRGRNMAECPPPSGRPLTDLVILLGKADDQVSFRGAFSVRLVVINGDEGQDVLTAPHIVGASPRQVRIDGGPGRDRITGSNHRDTLGDDEGEDTVRGGRGDDAFYLQGLRSGSYDGGSGRDIVDFSLFDDDTSLSLDLAAGTMRLGATRGRLRSIESAWGGPGDDRLTGTEAANRLIGDFGDDVLVGRGGNDELADHQGANLFDAGDGADRIDALSEDTADRADSIACGAGDDLVVSSDPGDLLEGDCERHTADAAGSTITVRPASLGADGIATFGFTCVPSMGQARCAGGLRVDGGPSRPYDVGAGPATITAELTAADARQAASAAGARVTVALSGSNESVGWTTIMRSR